jgi:hypothetical protein
MLVYETVKKKLGALDKDELIDMLYKVMRANEMIDENEKMLKPFTKR